MALSLTVVSALSLAFWVFVLLRGFFGSRSYLRLGPERSFEPPRSFPSVSIVVPARNEEEIVEDCVRSILSQDYPSFEATVVDDDSNDGTGEILDRLARENPGKLRVIHVKGDLPPGWVGKHYAMTLAAAQSRGVWLLLTDADIVYRPEALSRSMECALAKKADLFSLLPHPISIGFWERAVMPVFGVLLGLAFPIQDANDPRRRTAIAAGGFILIRREAFDAVGGYAPAADHIVDDVLMAQRVKEKGFRIFLAGGEKLLRTRMYRGLADLWEGITKSAAPAIHFRWWMLFAATCFFLAVAALPFAGVATLATADAESAWSWFGMLGSVNAALLLAAHAAVNRQMKIPLVYAALFPLGYLFYLAAHWASFFRGRFGAGVEWKGRKYYGAGNPPPKTKIQL